MVSKHSIRNYRLTDHAKLEMRRRQISDAEVAQILIEPAEIESVRAGRRIYQSKVKWGNPPEDYLLRVIVDIDRKPPEVVSAYRTGKIRKYWRGKQ